MDKWIGKVAVVTGASVGIGRDITLKLLEHGVKVVGCGRNYENLLKLRVEISPTATGEYTPFKCDVSKEEDVLSLFNFVKTNFKELSILINNAGLDFKGGSILHGKTDHWKTMFETNVLGICMCTREAFALIRQNESSKLPGHEVPGHIININSTAGHRILPFSSSHFYSSTKFAVTAITEGIRQELREAKSNVRVTQISPGLVETEFLRRAGGEAQETLVKSIIPIPLQSSDISQAVIFTLSAEPRSAVHEIIIRPNVQQF